MPKKRKPSPYPITVLGMTADEIKKYINQIAFSGATEFMEKFKEAKDANEIIGRFGLGFYSAFMVADKVEIQTLSTRMAPSLLTGYLRWQHRV
jgi:HSP90 family molecular chaperone